LKWTGRQLLSAARTGQKKCLVVPKVEEQRRSVPAAIGLAPTSAARTARTPGVASSLLPSADFALTSMPAMGFLLPRPLFHPGSLAIHLAWFPVTLPLPRSPRQHTERPSRAMVSFRATLMRSRPLIADCVGPHILVTSGALHSVAAPRSPPFPPA
jgi:hypothetical protein